MRVVCDLPSFARVLDAVVVVAPRQSPKPVLLSVLLECDPDRGSTLSATDLAVGVRLVVPGVQADAPFRALLPPRFRSILAAAGSEASLVLETTDDALTVFLSRSKYTLPREDPDLFPAVPGFGCGGYLAVPAGPLRQGLRRCVPCCDVESTRYALGGVLFESDPDALGTLVLVATDGRRLNRQDVPCDETPTPPTLSNGSRGTPVVPVKACKLIERLLDPDGPPAHVRLDPAGAAQVRTDAGVLHARLVEGRFPEWRQVIPPGHTRTAAVTAGPLRQALRQASITTSPESRGVDLTFGPERLLLESVAADVGSGRVELPLGRGCEPLTLAVDPRFLTDTLDALDPDAELTVELSDAKAPLVLRTGDGLTAVVMPLTRDR
jgi:DNA polymerase-3 subunit beta